MRIQDVILYSIKNLREWRLRSMLTMVGIIIGVLAMIIIVSIAQGSAEEIQKLIAKFGPDKMIIIPLNLDKTSGLVPAIGFTQQPVSKLFQRDADSVKSVSGVKMTGRVVSGKSSLKFRDKEISAIVYGADSDVFQLFEDFFKIEKGRPYAEGEVRVAVLGNEAATGLFGKNVLDVGNVILINKREYRVIGIMEKTGGTLSAHGDVAIFIPFEEGKELFKVELENNEISTIYVSLESGIDASDVKAEIEEKIASNHKVSPEDRDFSVLSADLVQREVSSIAQILSRLLAAITAVTIIVGGVGISNTMFMAVSERTRTIGIMKSIGASERDIQLLFLTESMIMGVLGGMLGLAIAWAALLFAGGFGIPYTISMDWAGFVLLFSAAVGLAAGYIPSRRASKLKPVEALRFI